MAFADLGSLGSTGATTNNQASLALTTTAAVAIGELVVVVVAVDNRVTGGGDDLAVSGVTNSGTANTWTKAIQTANNVAAQGGASVSLWYTVATAAMASGATITATFTNAATSDATAMTARHFSKGAGTTVAIEGTPGILLHNTALDPGALDVTTANIACLRIRACGIELGTATNWTPTASWTAFAGGQSATSGTTIEMAARAEFRIVTGTTASSNPTQSAAINANVYVAFREDTPAPITGTGVLAAQAAAIVTSPVGVSGSTGVGVLPAPGVAADPTLDLDFAGDTITEGGEAPPTYFATLAGVGEVAFVSEGTGDLDTGSASLAGAGITEGVGTGVLVAQDSALAATGISLSVGTGALAPQPAVIIGVGVAGAPEITGTGVLVAGAIVGAAGPTLDLDFAADTITEATAGTAPVLVGVGTVEWGVVSGTGVLTTGSATLAATGTVAGVGTGVLVAQASTLAGAGTSASTGTGILTAQAATVVGSGDVAAVVTSGTGVLLAQTAALVGEAAVASVGTGALVAQTSALTGAGFLASTGTGVLAAAPATIVGEGSAFGAGTGVLAAQAASLAAEGVSGSVGTGVLVCSPATILGQGTVGDVVPVDLFPPHGLPFLATVGQMMSRL